MKTCKNCGRVYDDNLSFCPNCNSRQVESFVGVKPATDAEYAKIQQEIHIKKVASQKASKNLFVFFMIVFAAIALGILAFTNTPQHKLDSQAKDTYSAALKQVKNGEYDNAIQTLNSINPEWSNYKKVDTEKAKIVKLKLKDTLPSYQAAGNYAGILSLITANIDDISADKEINAIYNDALAQYKNDVITQANSQINAGDLEGAANAMEKAAYASSDFELVKSAALLKAQAAGQNGDYVSAITFINNMNSIVGNDGEVQMALANSQQAYKQAVIAQAYDIYNSDARGYASALEVINGALTIIPDDADLLYEKEAYELCSPVSLKDITYFDVNRTDWWDPANDILGNHFDNVLGSYGDEEYIIFDIGKQYNIFGGTFFIDEYDKGGYGYVGIRIYGDGALLYQQSGLGADTKSFDIRVNVTGVTDLKICLDGDFFVTAQLGDPYLARTR